jgi:hypothetical protein
MKIEKLLVIKVGIFYEYKLNSIVGGLDMVYEHVVRFERELVF